MQAADSLRVWSLAVTSGAERSWHHATLQHPGMTADTGQSRIGDPGRERSAMAEFDLVIRGGTVVDGTGGVPIEADVGIKGDRIAAIGRIAKNGADEIEAKGKLVTPGFVDIHTHYDGQAVWDSR